jgi:hypothetical protein
VVPVTASLEDLEMMLMPDDLTNLEDSKNSPDEPASLISRQSYQPTGAATGVTDNHLPPFL